MKKRMNKMYVIKTQAMATYLMSKGFRLIKLDTDKNNPYRNVYLFKDSDELRRVMTTYQKIERK
jgi:hypothetical protein